MASKTLIPFLVTMMLVTGVCNTILTKYQDMQCVRNCDSPDPAQRVVFEQPVLQTLQMFVGEMGCWLVVLGFHMWNRHIKSRTRSVSETSLLAGGYQPVNDDANDEAESDNGLNDESTVSEALLTHREPNPPAKLVASDGSRIILNGWKTLLLAAPACCDITGTTLMNVGLLLVAASIYQMTRGALVLFVGLFSVLFLRRKLYLYQWLALVAVVLGVGLVGLAGAIFKESPKALHDLPNGGTQIVSRLVKNADAVSKTPDAVVTIIGVLLIAGAQIFTATQFVLEEWILEHYSMDPLRVVGWEGIFGFLVTAIGMVFLHLAIGRTDSGRNGYFDAREGWRAMATTRTVAVSSLLIMISIGGFNFFGLSVTRSVSATSRSTIDTCRTLFIWFISLSLGWESFKWLQVLGFAMLVYGTFLFNDIVKPPLKACLPSHHRVSEDGFVQRRGSLLPEEPIEHI